MSMRKGLKVTGIVAGSLLAAIAIILLAVWLFITPLARNVVQHILADTPEMSVDFNNLSVSPVKGHIELVRLQVKKDNMRATIDSLRLTSIAWTELVLTKNLNFDNLYVKNITYTSDDNMASIDSLRHSLKRTDIYGLDCHPKINKQKFADELGYQKGWMQLRVNHFYVTDLNMEKIINMEACKADSVEMDGMQFYMYSDATVEEICYQPMPMQLLRSMEFPVEIGHIGAKDGQIIYEEQSSYRLQTAKMTIYGINLDIPNFSNSPRAKGDITLSANVEKSLPITAHMTFDLADKTDRFTLTAQAGPGVLPVLNPYLVPNVLVNIRSGSLNNLQIVAAGDSLGMKGYLTIDYKNLKVDYLKQKDGVALQKRHSLVSFVANSMIPTNHPSKMLPESLTTDDLDLSGKNRNKGVKHIKGLKTPVTVVERTPYTSLPYLVFSFALKAVTQTLWE